MSLKILLADDSMTAQNMGKKILTDAGFDVLAVSNGAAAIKKIASDRPDIVILDVYMPGYTGLEVCERVKGASETSSIPVLLTVGKMEPFKPEEANRVRADGVMIKPFEATDLIAAIQGIANKKPGSAGASASPAAPSFHQPRVAPPPPPRPDDTVRIPPPHNDPAEYEETIRLTPEQIREFQEQAQRERGTEQQSKRAEGVPEMPVARASRPADDDTADLVISPAVSILEPVPPSALENEFEPAAPVVPGLDASEAPIARAMAGVTGNDFFTVTPSAAMAEESSTSESLARDTPAFFTPDEESQNIEERESVFKFRRPESRVAPFEAAVEIPITSEPAVNEVETSAPVASSGFFVPQATEFEPNVAPPVEVPTEASAAVPELEINSPIHAQQEVAVTQDPSLVTDSEDMSQFVTKFGQDNTEEIHVGVVVDLPPEQLAALTTPVDESTQKIEQEPPEFESAGTVYSAAFVEQGVGETPAEIPAFESPSPVFDEAGTIVHETALADTGPGVVYVPTFEDTQPLSAYAGPDLTAEPAIAAAPAFAAPEPVQESIAEAASAVSQVDSTTIEPEYAAPIMEAAAAVAAGFGGGSVVTDAAHFFTADAPESPVHEASVEMPREEVSASVEAVEEASASIGAAEIATAITETQAEEAGAIAVTPEISKAVDAVAGAEGRGITDNKVSEAVSHAFEKLRPQLIAEILKELTK